LVVSTGVDKAREGGVTHSAVESKMSGDESEKAYTDEVQASNAAVMESCMVMAVEVVV